MLTIYMKREDAELALQALRLLQLPIADTREAEAALTAALASVSTPVKLMEQARSFAAEEDFQ